MESISAKDKASFAADGFVVKRHLFDAEEMAYLERAYEEDEAIHRRAFGRADGRGGQTEIALWNEPGEDVFGAVARCSRMVDAAAELLGDEVYHYHSKINVKRPGTGGTWIWHQDYGYWYHNGCLYPDMATVAIPLTPMNAANGCLQVLAGSHLLGRIEHRRIGEQSGADPERMEAILSHFERVSFEAEPGDAMFFHCNTLHTSEPNDSDTPRNLLLVAYNTRHNNPYREHHHPRYTPIEKLSDHAIKERGLWHDGDARVFMDPRTDHSVDTLAMAKS